jgi:hypothetical protein
MDRGAALQYWTAAGKETGFRSISPPGLDARGYETAPDSLGASQTQHTNRRLGKSLNAGLFAKGPDNNAGKNFAFSILGPSCIPKAVYRTFVE